jgi:hypothetical protein
MRFNEKLPKRKEMNFRETAIIRLLNKELDNIQVSNQLATPEHL